MSAYLMRPEQRDNLDACVLAAVRAGLTTIPTVEEHVGRALRTSTDTVLRALCRRTGFTRFVMTSLGRLALSGQITETKEGRNKKWHSPKVAP